ncbi:MAG: family 78 glycoside hydrolase catalytic domain [Aristaeellaceae bacterium]
MMRITRCQVNHIANPMGYRLGKPVFSWVTEDAAGKAQQAARLRVWADAERAVPQYDSGWAPLDPLATETELTLAPRTRYYWTVAVRSDAREEAESDLNWFETGKLDEPWQGRWITCGRDEPRLPVFCRSFALPGRPIRDARLYICGLGLYEARINGRRVSDEYLTPYCNNYAQWVQYQTYDVTELLTRDNRLEVALGDGWYKGRFGFTSRPGDPGYYGDAWKLIAELRVRFADGTEQVLGTDDAWTVTRSRITFSNIYDGEHRDDTLPDLPGEKATLLEEAIPLCERMSIPVRVQEELQPIALLHTPAGEWVWDVGQNMTGSFRLRVHEPRGTRIHVQVGEVLQQGCFYRDNLRTARAEYVYVSDGEAHVLEPQFTFYGFRYVKVEGIAAPERDALTALALYSDVTPAGRLETGAPKINQLISNIRWGQKGNFLDVPTDCPQRDERMGWTADTQVFVPTACYFTDAAAFYRKYLYDLRTEQRMLGGMVPDVVPSAGHAGQGSSVWGDAATIIPWSLYLFYGDRSILAESFGSMKAWVDYIRREDGEDRGWGRHYHYGDWLALDHPAGGADQVKGATEDAFVAYVYYLYSARLVARAAAILGYADEERQYAALAEDIHRYILDEYYTPNGRCAITTQTGYVLTLHYHLNEDRPRALKSLLALIRAKGNKFVTGFVGTPLIQRVLSSEGEHDMAYRILFNEEYPGWLYEVNLGATTVWERWNSMEPDGSVSSTGMNSFNHYALGAVGEWMWGTMAGIQPDEAQPGFRHVVLQPVPNARLGSVRADYASPAGTYHVSWQVTDATHVTLDITVPFNCRATLRLPWAAGQAETELSAGDYHFTLEAREALIRVHSTREPLGDLLDHPAARAVLTANVPLIDQAPAAMRDAPLRDTLLQRPDADALIAKLDALLAEVPD